MEQPGTVATTGQAAKSTRPRSAGWYIAATTIGSALEVYDFLIYVFFSIQIGRTVFPAHGPYGSLMVSLLIFGTGFVTRPIGAIIIGNYADRSGRRPAMIFCLIAIGCSSTAMALIPTYAQIGLAAPILAAIARLVQGFAFGGEVGSNTAYLAELAPPQKRGLVVSLQGVSQYSAIILGGLVGAVLSAAFSQSALDDYGWRIAFLLGTVVVPFGLWLRTDMPETLHLPNENTSTKVVDQSRLTLVRAHWRPIVIGLAALGSTTIGGYTFIYIVTYSQATLHMTAQDGFVAQMAGYTMGIPALLLGGWLSDRYGRWPVNVCGNFIFLIMIYPTFLWITNARSLLALTVGMILLVSSISVISGSFYANIAESLPKSIRGSGFGTVYSLSIAIFGGTTPVIATWLIHVSGSALAPAWYLVGATMIGQIALMQMLESAPVRTTISAGHREQF